MCLYVNSIVYLLVVTFVSNSVVRAQYDDCDMVDVYNCDSRNPCTERKPNDSFYFAHDDARRFVQCDDFDKCFTKDCAAGTVWSQNYLACITGNAIDVE